MATSWNYLYLCDHLFQWEKRVYLFELLTGSNSIYHNFSAFCHGSLFFTDLCPLKSGLGIDVFTSVEINRGWDRIESSAIIRKQCLGTSLCGLPPDPANRFESRGIGDITKPLLVRYATVAPEFQQMSV